VLAGGALACFVILRFGSLNNFTLVWHWRFLLTARFVCGFVVLCVGVCSEICPMFAEFASVGRVSTAGCVVVVVFGWLVVVVCP